jgi:beta-glucosidase
VWDTFSHTEGNVTNGDTGDIACDHYRRMPSDVALMAELGLQTYRFSISWPRVMPDGRSDVNQRGLDFYRRLVDELLAHDIVPNATLFHWDLPQALEDLGGFRSRDTVRWFADYAARMVDALDGVQMWATFNEPWCHAFLGHASGVHAPGMVDPQAAVTVAHHELLAHGLALQSMRAQRDDLRLGMVLNAQPIRAEGVPAPPAEQLRLIDAMQNRWWLDSMLRGTYPDDLLASFGPLANAIQPGDLGTIAQPLDWLGLNYYFDVLLRGIADDESVPPLLNFPTSRGVTDAPIRAEHTDMGWPLTPEGFTGLLVRLRDEYPNLPPIYITENGCAYDDNVVDGRCADQRRIAYLDSHLRALHDGMQAGVDVRGYYQWSLMDNFEWALGYAKRFGLVHVDFDTLERTPRDSAWWYRDVIRCNGLA